jgi:hypothetical protein
VNTDSSQAIWALVIWIGSILATRALASAKGLSAGGWGIAALFVGPLALIALIFVPRHTPFPPGPMRRCPHCQSEIPTEATVCRFCTRDVPADTPHS